MRFTTKLLNPSTMDSALIIIPCTLIKKLQPKGRTAVAGTINGVTYRSSIFPAMGQLKSPKFAGNYFMVINKPLRAAAQIQVGDTVTVVMECDTTKRTVTTPVDIKKALLENKLWDGFNKLAYTHQKEYVEWIVEAKKPETRVRRIEKLVVVLPRS